MLQGKVHSDLLLFTLYGGLIMREEYEIYSEEAKIISDYIMLDSRRYDNNIRGEWNCSM